MKKFLFSALLATISTTFLIAVPKAVVFDWGDVMGFVDRSVLVNFMCDSLQLSEAEFEAVNLKKKEAMKAGKPEVAFWLEFAAKKGVTLSENWEEKHSATLRKALGADPNMYKLVDQIKETGMRVGMLSNVDDRGRHLLRGFGLYEPFDPCVLSCEVGLEKPDPKIYELLLKTLSLPAGEVVFIDDKEENVEAAKKLGIDAITFKSEEQIREELDKRGVLQISPEQSEEKLITGSSITPKTDTVITKDFSVVSGLDPATADFLKGFSQVFASIEHLPIPEQRATIKEMFHVPESQLEPVAMTEDKVIPGRNGPINIRLFSPKLEGPLPVIVYFHRGGWVYGSVEESEMICRKLANETGAIVIAVDYRLSPEHTFPVPLEDCYDATQWVVEHASMFKIAGNPGKLILCGESAGGNLAAAVGLMARDANAFTIAGQLLIYPVLTSELKQEHYDQSPDKLLLSLENMQFFLDTYLPSPEDRHKPYAAPLKSETFANLPSCFIVTAQHDALKHEGALYGENLQKSGVNVQTKCYPGVIHGFLDLPLADAVKQEAMKDIGVWVKSCGT